MNSEKANKNRSKLIEEIIVKLSELKSVRENPYVSGELNHISNRMSDNTFRIAVVGEFSSGKSTFINALIGRDILSHARLETTAAITYIRNVAKDDKRCNTCIVCFRDGTEKTLENLDDISNYTTVQSNSNVAERISSVTLFVNFLGNDTPVLVVDTPGLNGIAEHHREITIEEIKKAHTCIYLLSSSGITKSDAGFIRLLNDYQETFLFLQNFIDELSASEGDSAESKIMEDDRIIRENILNEGKKFNYNIIGISSLKALASKDKSIKKLYSSDSREISDDERIKLYHQSNFAKLEQHLKGLIETEEYKAVILESVIRRLSIILEGLLGQLDEEQKLNEEMRSKDEGVNRINAAKAVIEQMQKTKEDREKRLRNFVKSLSDKQCMLIEQHMKELLQSLYCSVCKDIESKITGYQEFLDFSSKYGKGPSLYYSSYVAERINQDIAPDILNNTDLILHHIYEATIERVESYTNTQRIPGKIQFSIASLTDVFHMEETESYNNIGSIEKSIDNCRSKISGLQKEISDLKIKLAKSEEKEKRIYGMIDDCNEEKNRKISALGSRPAVRTWQTSKVVETPRGGLFGGLGDKIFGVKQKTVYEQHSDNTEQVSWDNKKNVICNEYRAKERDLKNQLSDARFDSDTIRDEIRQKHSGEKKLEQEIVFFQEQLIIQKDIYANEVKLSQNKFCDRQKKQLKASIEERLINIANESSTSSYFSEYIHNIFDKNEKTIEEKGIEAFRKGLEEQRDAFERLIKESTQELEKRYQSNETELCVINDIYNTIISVSNSEKEN